MRLSSTAEFINEQQAFLSATAHHLLHVNKMAGVGAQVVFNALFVANINEYVVEDSDNGVLFHRDGHATLYHVLQKTDSL